MASGLQSLPAANLRFCSCYGTSVESSETCIKGKGGGSMAARFAATCGPRAALAARQLGEAPMHIWLQASGVAHCRPRPPCSPPHPFTQPARPAAAQRGLFTPSCRPGLLAATSTGELAGALVPPTAAAAACAPLPAACAASASCQLTPPLPLPAPRHCRRGAARPPMQPQHCGAGLCSCHGHRLAGWCAAGDVAAAMHVPARHCMRGLVAWLPRCLAAVPSQTNNRCCLLTSRWLLTWRRGDHGAPLQQRARVHFCQDWRQPAPAAGAPAGHPEAGDPRLL